MSCIPPALVQKPRFLTLGLQQAETPMPDNQSAGTGGKHNVRKHGSKCCNLQGWERTSCVSIWIGSISETSWLKTSDQSS
eukprot:4969604-Amphidinium_carterae.1